MLTNFQMLKNQLIFYIVNFPNVMILINNDVNSDDDFADTIFIATVAIVILVYSTYLFFNWEKDKLDFSQCCD